MSQEKYFITQEIHFLRLAKQLIFRYFVWMTAQFSRCFGRNYSLENQVPTKFQIFSHPASTSPTQLAQCFCHAHFYLASLVPGHLRTVWSLFPIYTDILPNLPQYRSRFGKKSEQIGVKTQVNYLNKLGQCQSQTPFSSAFWVQKDFE